MALAIGRCLRFPDRPFLYQFACGERLAKERQPLTSALDGDRDVIGTWWHGIREEGVEQAIRVSPGMASRWLGYLNASEHWSLAELQIRWDDLAHTMSRQVLFVVQLSNFPKDDPLQEGVNLGSRHGSLDLDKAILTYPKPCNRPLDAHDHFAVSGSQGRLEAQITPLVRMSSDNWHQLFRPWWAAIPPELGPLKGDTACAPSPYDYCLGDYHTAFYLVSVQIPDELYMADHMTLHLMNGEREREAEFRLR